MLDATAVAAALKDAGITQWYGVPDSLLSALITEFNATPAVDVTTTANEGAAVAAAAGHFLATGDAAGVYLQNSGVGNAINPLVSLAHQDVYSIPMVLVVGWRGYPGTSDEPQHMAQGRATTSMLESAGVTIFELPDSDRGAAHVVFDAYRTAIRESNPVAVLVAPGRLPSSVTQQAESALLPTREAAIEAVLDAIGETSIVVATTGKTGRELFELRVRRAENSASDYLNVGAMGHAPAVALGMATARPDRHIVILDGDGAAAMHLGTQMTIANKAPSNLIHILFNNESHESVGGQPTDLKLTSLSQVASASGYRSTTTVDTLTDLAEATASALTETGPTFIEALVQTGSRRDLGRPAVSRSDSRDAIRQKFDS